MNQLFRNIIVIFLLCFFGRTTLLAQNNNEIFSKLLGVEVQTEKEIITQLLNDEPGKKIFVDSDQDGKTEILYMIDPDERHETRFKPILVKIIDEDGDMYLLGEGDTDSDLYIADWNADGTVDRIIDYVDLDNDNDQDEQIQYFWSDSTITSSKYRRAWYDSYLPVHYPGKSYYICWAKDIGDDNRLWGQINYDYVQTITQWMSDYNGDETLVNMFFYDYKSDKIIPVGETTFSFYDLDHDTFSEEALRFVGRGLIADNLRYSCDIDNDAGNTKGATTHDYDFSVSCIGPVVLPPEKSFRVKLRGYFTEPIIKWAYMRETAKTGNWRKSHLTWDENDNNISDPIYKPADFVCNERWEGVINHPSEFMERVGGPSCGFFNKRKMK